MIPSAFTKEQQAENRKKWVEALRSGDYKQTTGALKNIGANVDMFCCLGVACDLSGLGKWRFPHQGEIDYWDGESMQSGVLTPRMQDWLGVNNSEVEVYIDDEETGERRETLVSLNDSGWTFEQIADLIEDERITLRR